jgi:hypothetical protein
MEKQGGRDTIRAKRRNPFQLIESREDIIRRKVAVRWK